MCSLSSRIYSSFYCLLSNLAFHKTLHIPPAGQEMDIRLALVLEVVLVAALALVQAGLLVKGLAVAAKVLALGSLSTYTYSHIGTFACSGPPVAPHTPADSSPLVVHNHNRHHHLA
jgi:hypothetical protein